MSCDAKRTLVTFKSMQFNTSQVKDYFMNPQCFGDDVAHWLIKQLSARGIAADHAPGQEDFGWFFSFEINGTAYRFVVGYRTDDGTKDEGTWIAWIERRVDLVRALFGAQNRHIDCSATRSIDQALSDRNIVSDVRWHDRRDFDLGQEDRGSPSPDG